MFTSFHFSCDLQDLHITSLFEKVMLVHSAEDCISCLNASDRVTMLPL